jgi:MFS family permease
MVAMMTLAGHLAIGKGHDAEDVLHAVAAHIAGMYFFGFAVGYFVDVHGPRRWLVIGSVLLGASALVLALSDSMFLIGVSMFTLGLGWSFAFIAASAALVRAAAPSQRGRVLGLADLLSGLTAAALALVGGLAVNSADTAVLGVIMAVVALAPVPLVLLARHPVYGRVKSPVPD